MFSIKRLKYWFDNLSPAQILLSFYLIAIVCSTLALSLPFVYKQNVNVAFIDILFTAVSAFSVTGLTTIDIAQTFNTIGIVILIIILHLGAVGIMAVSTLIWLFIGRKIGLTERRLIMADQNQTTFAGMVDLVKQIIYVVLIVELVAVLILGTYYLHYYSSAGDAYFHAFFSTISAISNAGFEIGPHGFEPYKTDYFIQTIYMCLIIFGAIGFPVLIEVKAFFTAKQKRKQKYHFSLFTKLTTTTFFLLIGIGTVFIYLIDINKYFSGKTGVATFFNAIFQSVTTRSAGLSTIDVSLLSETNHLFMSILMFIGASPSSSGGGIRTTTFALVIIFIITFARGGKKIKLFNREVYTDDLLKAVTVMIMATILIVVSIIILSLIEPHSITALLFETTSAFGTVGLSLGITSELTAFSKVILMILMFIGRVGVVTFLLSFRKDDPLHTIRYPKERIIIG